MSGNIITYKIQGFKFFLHLFGCKLLLPSAGVTFAETKGTPTAGEQFKYIVKCKIIKIAYCKTAQKVIKN